MSFYYKIMVIKTLQKPLTNAFSQLPDVACFALATFQEEMSWLNESAL